MKKIVIILVIIALTGCSALDQLTMFDLKYESKFTIPKNSLVNIPVDLESPDVTTNTEEQFAIHNTHKDLIEEIKLKELQLEIQNQGYSFRFLESVELFLKADGLPEIKVASKMRIPDDVGNRLALDVTDADLSAYLKKDKISLRAKTVADESITEDIRVKVFSVFRVDAKILGL